MLGVLEFKQTPAPDQLKATAIAALQQISKRQYHTLIQDACKQQVHQYGIDFYGKQLAISHHLVKVN